MSCATHLLIQLRCCRTLHRCYTPRLMSCDFRFFLIKRQRTSRTVLFILISECFSVGKDVSAYFAKYGEKYCRRPQTIRRSVNLRLRCFASAIFPDYIFHAKILQIFFQKRNSIKKNDVWDWTYSSKRTWVISHFVLRYPTSFQIINMNLKVESETL